MAKPKKTAEIAENKDPVEPLASAAGRAWLEANLRAAEREEQLGPNGQGWTYNEGKRAEVIERAEFLRALIAALPE